MDQTIIIVPAIFIGLPWIIMHYITKWKTAATITNDDEHLLEELYSLAKRLDERMDTVERLVASDNPDFKPARIMHDREIDNEPLRELDRLLAEKKGTASEQPPHHALSRQAERQADGRLLRASPTTPGSTRSGCGWRSSLLIVHRPAARSSRPTSSPACCSNKKPAHLYVDQRRAEVLAGRAPVAQAHRARDQRQLPRHRPPPGRGRDLLRHQQPAPVGRDRTAALSAARRGT